MPFANKPDPKPLPDPPFSAGTPIHTAFEVCKTLEKKDQWLIFDVELGHSRSADILHELTPMVTGRVLGYGLLYPTSDVGRDLLTADIIICKDKDEDLAALAHLCVYALLRVFYNTKRNTPLDSNDQSPSLSVRPPGPEHILEKSTITAEELGVLAMTRENGRCPVSGRVDMDHISEKDDPTKVDSLELAHIISQSISKGIRGGSEEARQKFNWASTAAAIIEHFGGFSTRALLGPQNLNSPRNAMSLAPFAHERFDGLDLWLTPWMDHGIVTPNKYAIGSSKTYMLRAFLPYATFKAHTLPNGKTIEPPSPQLLALHAACAQIAHMSGAAGILEETFRDTDDIPLMTAADNSAAILSHALKKVQLEQVPRAVYT